MQQQAQQQQPNVPQAEVQQYNRMRQDYAEVFRVFLDIEDEKKEHGLVMDAIKNIDQSRRCWRLVGGVLVERNMQEVFNSLKENFELLEKTGMNYSNVMKQREKELMEFEMKHNLRPNQPQQQQQHPSQQQGQKITGVLT